jgi:hypothetical protein
MTITDQAAETKGQVTEEPTPGLEPGTCRLQVVAGRGYTGVHGGIAAGHKGVVCGCMRLYSPIPALHWPPKWHYACFRLAGGRNPRLRASSIHLRAVPGGTLASSARASITRGVRLVTSR